MPHDFPIDAENLLPESSPLRVPISDERRRELFDEMMRIPVRKLAKYFGNACIGEFEPMLTPAQLDQVLTRTPTEGITALLERIRTHGTAPMLARVRASLERIGKLPAP